MKRACSIFGTTAAMILVLTACSGMSKGKAKDMLQKRYDEDKSLYCSLKRAVAQEKGGVYSGPEKTCIKQLAKAGLVSDTGCAQHFAADPSDCMTWGFKPAKATISKNVWLKFPCGTKTLGEVKSVTTEGKKATVKYTRTFKLDDGATAELTDCVLDPIQEGESEGTATLKQDDSGNWSEDR